MEPVLVVALVGLGLVTVAVAVYLIATARALMRVSSQLQGVLSAVATLSESVPPGKGVLDDINTNLAEVQDLLEGLPGEKRPGEPGERLGEPADPTDRH